MNLMRENIMNIKSKFSKLLSFQSHTKQFQASSTSYYDHQHHSSHSVHRIEVQNQQQKIMTKPTKLMLS